MPFDLLSDFPSALGEALPEDAAGSGMTSSGVGIGAFASGVADLEATFSGSALMRSGLAGSGLLASGLFASGLFASVFAVRLSQV